MLVRLFHTVVMLIQSRRLNARKSIRNTMGVSISLFHGWNRVDSGEKQNTMLMSNVEPRVQAVVINSKTSSTVTDSRSVRAAQSKVGSGGFVGLR